MRLAGYQKGAHGHLVVSCDAVRRLCAALPVQWVLASRWLMLHPATATATLMTTEASPVAQVVIGGQSASLAQRWSPGDDDSQGAQVVLAVCSYWPAMLL